ncbi:MAG: FecR domain-containing protein [Puia sp.]
MTEQRFLELLQIFKAGPLSGEQDREWQEAIDLGEHDEMLSREMQKDFEAFRRHTALSPERKALLLDRIRWKANMRPVPQEAVHSKRVISISFRWAAAASVVILLGTSLYFFLNKKRVETGNDTATTRPKDIAPGGNKATLTLANGSKIILDSTHTGLLAKQNGADIVNSGNGKLVYNSTEEKGTSVSYNTLTTPRGGQYQLALPDGTTVWLNAESRIDYPTRFADKSREVFIEGEVYFEVAKDPGRPFLVSMAAKTRIQGESGHWMQIEVLGTHFNVKAYHDDRDEPVKITLLEGSVNVLAHGSIKTIRPGQQASASFTDNQIGVTDKVDLDKVMAWKNGRMTLTNSSVEQVMRDISRWYDVDIKYNGTIPGKQFYGSIHRNVPLSSVLNALKAYGVNTKLEGKTIIVE